MEIPRALSPPLYFNKCSRTDRTKWGALTDPLDSMHVPPIVQFVCWFVFDPKWAAINDLNWVWSSTSLCGAPMDKPNPLREAMTSQWYNLRALLSLTILSTNPIVPSMTQQWPVAVRQQCARVTIIAATMCQVSAHGAGDTILYQYWL